MKYTAYYPTGKKFTIEGQFEFIPVSENEWAAAIETSKEEIVILDPRAVIEDQSGAVVYHPRHPYFYDRINSSMRQALDEDQDWPQRVFRDQGRLNKSSMKLLADKIREDNAEPKLIEAIDQAMILKVDNVYRLLKDEDPDAWWPSFCCCVPPAREIWVEFKEDFSEFGCMISRIDMVKDPEELVASIRERYANILSSECRWFLLMSPISSSKNHINYDRLSVLNIIQLRSDGSIIKTPRESSYHMVSTPQKGVDFYRKGSGFYVYIVLGALTFTNTKNVQLIENEPPTRPQKKRARKRKLPRLKYYTLEVTPTRKVYEPTGNKTDIKRSLHICRGHFKTYTKEKPLFGKYVGTYWVDAHVRGDLRQGIVVKDYEVSPS